ncbi:MAG: tetratricopeptide repeat-containing sulfotransferase family protein [Planctomycetota bacterium]
MQAADSKFAAEVQALLAQGYAQRALEIADRWCGKSRQQVGAWLARASANSRLGRVDAADRDLEVAARIAPTDDRVFFLRGLSDQQLARLDASITRLRPLTERFGPYATEAWMGLADSLWVAGRYAELAEEVARAGPWKSDPRHALHAARCISRTDPARAVSELAAVAQSQVAPSVRRLAGFDAVRLLDRLGRYRDAFDLAQKTHAQTGLPFDLDAFLQPVLDERQRSVRKAPRAQPLPAVDGLAMFVAVPRSGTTLLEQMLDAHPQISGIGEYDGLRFIGEALQSLACGGRSIDHLQSQDALRLQGEYLADARRRQRAGSKWMVDKNLRAWRLLPELAAVLPGTRCLHVVRDPRDTAISILLSYFQPHSDGWTASLESIRRVLEAVDSVLPDALASHGLEHVTIVYERLVEDSAAEANRCLKMLGLDLAEAVLRPEANRRSVFTLSHAQVQAPINASAIGRWQNYSWAFGAEWDSLAARHDARRAAK